MSYYGANGPGRGACVCRPDVRGVRRCFCYPRYTLGDDATGSATTGAGGPPPGTDPIAFLTQQVNRFMGDGPPPGYQFGSSKFPIKPGVLDPAVAALAVVIYQRRAMESGDLGMIARSYAVPLTSAQNFVTSNLAEVTSVIQGFADSKGIPATDQGLFSSVPTPVLIAAAAVAALWLMKAR